MTTELSKMQLFPHASPSNDGAPSSRFVGWVLLFIAVQIVVDLGMDYFEGGASILHLGIEAITGITSLVLGFRLLRAVRSGGRTITRLEGALRASQLEAESWRGETAQVLQGLGRALDLQFERWNLSQAERGVALFLLKGFSTRDIADLRSTSERTVRQQAQDVYRKAGLSGRAELSAFFLEDLLLPPTNGGNNAHP